MSEQSFGFKNQNLGFTCTDSWFTARQFLQAIPSRESLILEFSDCPYGECEASIGIFLRQALS